MSKIFCPLSYSTKFKKLYTIPRFPVFMGVTSLKKNYKFQDLKWWINKDSGNIQIFPKIDLDVLYFKSHGSGTVGKTWRRHHQMFFNVIKPYLKGNICEIGGGENSMLNWIDDFSNIKKFYSFDKNLRIKKRNKKIISVKNYFDQNYFIKKKLEKKFDLVIHSHTFEHLYNPDIFLKTIESMLSKSGKHIFAVPNMMPMIKKGYANCMNFEHPFFFDEKLIDNLLFKNKFRIKKKKYFKKDHSIMYVSSLRKVSKKFEYKRYDVNRKIFTNLFNLWNKDITNLNQKIKNNKNIFIFGAHIFSQLLLFNGLNKSNVVGILDNDKNKINKYLYGTKYKILKPNFLSKISSPTVILRAGSYNREIKKQLLKINKKVRII